MSIADNNIDYNGCNLNETDIVDHSCRYALYNMNNVPVCLDSVFYVSDTLLHKFGK